MKAESESSRQPQLIEQSPPESPPLAELLSRLSGDLQLLTRQEAALAKHELSESLNQAKQQAAALALGGAALLAGVMVLLAAAVLALALVLPAWGAALIVGGFVSLVGTALLLTGKAKLSQVRLKPARTVDSVEQDMKAMKRAVT
jgi:hypothetical protein